MYNGVYIVFFLKSKYLTLGKLVNKLQYISIMEYFEEYFQLESKFYIYLLIGKNISEITLENPGYPKVYICIYVFVHICTCSPILLKIFIHRQRKKKIYTQILSKIFLGYSIHMIFILVHIFHILYLEFITITTREKLTFYKFKMCLQLVTLAREAQFYFLIAKTF